MSSNKIKTGPKPMIITDADIEKIENMSGMGLTMEQIASIFGVNKRTLERRMHEDDRLKDALDSGRAKAHLRISNVAYKMAASGNVPAMTMFWLKCRAGWKETSVQEHSGTLKLEDIVGRSMKIGKEDR